METEYKDLVLDGSTDIQVLFSLNTLVTDATIFSKGQSDNSKKLSLTGGKLIF